MKIKPYKPAKILTQEQIRRRVLRNRRAALLNQHRINQVIDWWVGNNVHDVAAKYHVRVDTVHDNIRWAAQILSQQLTGLRFSINIYEIRRQWFKGRVVLQRDRDPRGFYSDLHDADG